MAVSALHAVLHGDREAGRFLEFFLDALHQCAHGHRSSGHVLSNVEPFTTAVQMTRTESTTHEMPSMVIGPVVFAVKGKLDARLTSGSSRAGSGTYSTCLGERH
jgi:hypothetical protein